ncbi:MAG: methyltransferase [Deltaproteobacteria bacterium]|nr:methyltransferase [Deltaproteobacteria bacterium]
MSAAATHPIESPLEAEDPLTDDPLTADYRLLQRKRGHRYSLDDVATAREAARVTPAPDALCDLGCGIGSVLLMLGWKFPRARLVGVEAQTISIDLARRNVQRNGAEGRTRLLHADLRDESLTERLGERFALITGTPPYQPLGTATPSPDAQRAHARMELRGGVEEYLLAASRVLAPAGRFVVCAEGRRPERVFSGARVAGLRVSRQLSVWPREGRPGPLFHVFTLVHQGESPAHEEPEYARFVARDLDGERTDEYVAMRAFFGLPRTS